MEYYQPIKRNDIVTYATTYMNLSFEAPAEVFWAGVGPALWHGSGNGKRMINSRFYRGMCQRMQAWIVPFLSSPHLAVSVEVGEEGSRILNCVGQVFVRRRSSGVGRRESKFSL